MFSLPFPRALPLRPPASVASPGVVSHADIRPGVEKSAPRPRAQTSWPGGGQRLYCSGMHFRAWQRALVRGLFEGAGRATAFHCAGISRGQRQRGRQAHQQHLHQARPAQGGRRPPPSAGRPALARRRERVGRVAKVPSLPGPSSAARASGSFGAVATAPETAVAAGVVGVVGVGVCGAARPETLPDAQCISPPRRTQASGKTVVLRCPDSQPARNSTAPTGWAS